MNMSGGTQTKTADNSNMFEAAEQISAPSIFC